MTTKPPAHELAPVLEAMEHLSKFYSPFLREVHSSDLSSFSCPRPNMGLSLQLWNGDWNFQNLKELIPVLKECTEALSLLRSFIEREQKPMREAEEWAMEIEKNEGTPMADTINYIKRIQQDAMRHPASHAHTKESLQKFAEAYVSDLKPYPFCGGEVIMNAMEIRDAAVKEWIDDFLPVAVQKARDAALEEAAICVETVVSFGACTTIPDQADRIRALKTKPSTVETP